MKPVDFDYMRPASIAEAIAGLDSPLGGTARIMAGGQTLGPMLNLRFVQPDLVIDISRITELQRVEAEGGMQVLGACITHAAIEDGRVPDVTRGMLPRVAAGIAYRAVRTRGTIGGSLAHADPAADWVTCLTALGALVSISGRKGRRPVPLTGFIKGPLTTDLGAEEIIDGVHIPRLEPQARWGYHKICRKTGEFAGAIGAVVIDRGLARIVAGATTGRPVVIDMLARDVLDHPANGLDLPAWLTQAGLHGDAYEIGIHAAAVRRAIAEAAA